MVIEVLPASAKGKCFGTLMNVWDSAIEVFGPDAIDGGKGGRFVLLLPDCDGQLVTRRFPAAAMSFTPPVGLGEEDSHSPTPKKFGLSQRTPC